MRQRLGTRVWSKVLAVLALAPTARAEAPAFDVILRGGTVYDGTGGPALRTDVGIRGDEIAAVGDLSQARAARVVEAKGLAVAPGFINMLSWSVDSLIADGRSQGE
ncbi:MAG TPA: D-aminoacylase, partial [Vicinamibacteria bacterium]